MKLNIIQIVILYLSLIVKIPLYFKNVLTNTSGLIFFFSGCWYISQKFFEHKKQYKKGLSALPAFFVIYSSLVRQTHVYVVSILWMSHCITETSLLSVLLLTNQKSIQIHSGQVSCNEPWTHPKTQVFSIKPVCQITLGGESWLPKNIKMLL